MEKKEYLNEEWYQKIKKKLTRISLIILIVGFVIGLGLIVAGVITQNNAKKTNQERYEAAVVELQEKKNKANTRLNEIAVEKQTLQTQMDEKEYECDSIKTGSQNWIAEMSKCNKEVSSIRQKISTLEAEEMTLKFTSAIDIVTYTPVNPLKYLICYYIGASIIGISIIAALAFYLIAKKREITAFTIQQTMPVTQEVIDKMAPTVGNAVGTIGKELAKGVTSGIQEAKTDTDNQQE